MDNNIASTQESPLFRNGKVDPETNPGEDSWKIDKLTKDHYSSFKQTWFTNKSEERWPLKRKLKSEEGTDSDSGTADQGQSEPTAKRTRLESVSSEHQASSESSDDFSITTTMPTGSSDSAETTSTTERLNRNPDSSESGKTPHSSHASVAADASNDASDSDVDLYSPLIVLATTAASATVIMTMPTPVEPSPGQERLVVGIKNPW